MSSLKGFLAVAIQKVFDLIVQEMLNRDVAAQRLHAYQVAVRDSLAVIEEPIQSFERHVAIHLLEHTEEAREAFVVSRVQAERPLVRREQRDDFPEFTFERRRQIRAGFEKVLKVRR